MKSLPVTRRPFGEVMVAPSIMCCGGYGRHDGSVAPDPVAPPEGGDGFFPPPPPPPGNNRPTAAAGPDQTGVREGALVTLDGSGNSDPDDDPLKYRWNQDSGARVALSSRDVVNPSLTAPEELTADAVLRFRLLVTDPHGLFDADTVAVTVTVTDEANEKPGKPLAPTFSAATPDSLTVEWEEPENSGPAITDYDVQYREGGGHEPMPPHSVVLSIIGACLLWVGWFGFNAGSALSAGSLSASAFAATHFAAAAILGWVIAEWWRNGKPGVLGAITGAVAGLVAITPASGFVTPMAAIFIGFSAGVICYLFVGIVKHRLGYDDSLDAFGVHGVGGMLGALLTGVFATKAVNDGFDGAPMGLLEGNAAQVLNQAGAVLVTWALAAVGTMIILKVVDLLIGLRVPDADEMQGLDITQHGQQGYVME